MFSSKRASKNKIVWFLYTLNDPYSIQMYDTLNEQGYKLRNNRSPRDLCKNNKEASCLIFINYKLSENKRCFLGPAIPRFKMTLKALSIDNLNLVQEL